MGQTVDEAEVEEFAVGDVHHLTGVAQQSDVGGGGVAEDDTGRCADHGARLSQVGVEAETGTGAGATRAGDGEDQVVGTPAVGDGPMDSVATSVGDDQGAVEIPGDRRRPYQPVGHQASGAGGQIDGRDQVGPPLHDHHGRGVEELHGRRLIEPGEGNNGGQDPLVVAQ